MTELTLTKTRITGGHWEGMLLAEGASEAPDLQVFHLEQKIEGVTLTADGEMAGLWQVRVPIPLEALCDGVQTFLIRLAGSDEVLERFTVITGQPLEDDIRAELDLLRAELDLLKSAFRRHCLEVAGQ
ncbi:hypothetical protein IV417_08140 [Alphaproteobacteria bacterium KMM 3653]|uniref:Uncharacterized protein n=1 Tax=Harenicola maris TaxID=2841044 RepID=A0AAP2CMW9_9RHOB|nr:hypothetical protein [Harenicola maris]